MVSERLKPLFFVYSLIVLYELAENIYHPGNTQALGEHRLPDTLCYTRTGSFTGP